MSEEFLRRRALEHMFLDSLGTAERVTGKPYAEDKATSALGYAIHLQNSMMKHSILSELGDTYWGISWQAFLEIIDDLGFDIIEDRQFTYDTGDGRVRYPVNLIAAHVGKKLLLHATSWIDVDEDGAEVETVNDGTIYGAAYLEDSPDRPAAWKMFAGCSGGPLREDNVWPFSFDVREGLVTRLMRIEEQATLVDWNDPDRILCLFDYSENKKHGDAWLLRRDKIFASAPESVRSFIGFPK